MERRSLPPALRTGKAKAMSPLFRWPFALADRPRSGSGLRSSPPSCATLAPLALAVSASAAAGPLAAYGSYVGEDHSFEDHHSEFLREINLSQANVTSTNFRSAELRSAVFTQRPGLEWRLLAEARMGNELRRGDRADHRARRPVRDCGGGDPRRAAARVQEHAALAARAVGPRAGARRPGLPRLRGRDVELGRDDAPRRRARRGARAALRRGARRSRRDRDAQLPGVDHRVRRD